MRRNVLILHSIQAPAPLDVRDAVTSYRELSEIDEAVNELVYKTYDYLNDKPIETDRSQNALAALSVGDSIAENEFATLGNYYIRTDDFGRARRGEVNLVVGRKGTGKTALWSQLRDDIRRNSANIVVDLKPEGYQLIKLKEAVLGYLTEGAKFHLITAFWEYILYMELAYKLLEKDSEKYMRDNLLYDKYLKLEGFFQSDAIFASEGDFSERLKGLSERLIDRYQGTFGSIQDRSLSAEEITVLLYSEHLRQLRNAVIEYVRNKDEIWILFDNLDKGWASYGLANEDVFILRCLLDASRKVGNDVRRAISKFHVIVFIRSDIYQMLMDETPDFGKEMKASLDWSDEQILKNILFRRLKASRSGDIGADQLWSEICAPYYEGQKTLDYFLSLSFMRPRNLIKLFNYCRGVAVNREKSQIGDEEIERGLQFYSDDILIDFSNEVRDLCAEAQDFLYEFIGEKVEYTHDELIGFIKKHGIPDKISDQMVDYMLYYGIFGVSAAGSALTFIFDTGFDIKKLKALAGKGMNKYYLHPALRPALGVKQ